MKRITSFTVDHDLLTEGIYVSRIDGDITTYDMRTRVPNSGDYMDTTTAHTVEHMFATFVRNSEISDDVIYFGPMGCRTGFYLLVRNADNQKVLEITKKTVAEANITCLMITHNMQSALDLGNRTVMMNHGRIIFDTEGAERKKLTVQDLLTQFKKAAGEDLDNDRMLLS